MRFRYLGRSSKKTFIFCEASLKVVSVKIASNLYLNSGTLILLLLERRQQGAEDGYRDKPGGFVWVEGVSISHESIFQF